MAGRQLVPCVCGCGLASRVPFKFEGFAYFDPAHALNDAGFRRQRRALVAQLPAARVRAASPSSRAAAARAQGGAALASRRPAAVVRSGPVVPFVTYGAEHRGMAEARRLGSGLQVRDGNFLALHS